MWQPFSELNTIQGLPAYLDTVQHSGIVVLVDNKVASLHNVNLANLYEKICPLFVLSVPDGEINKNLSTCETIFKTFYQYSIDRNVIVVVIGGGMLCDLGAFVASVWKRGLRFVLVPTTLLAQTDAAWGGKCGVDFLGAKNLIGLFAQPECIVIEVDFLQTLDKRQFFAGLAESWKHAIVADALFFEYLTHFDFYVTNNRDELKNLVTQSIQIKRRITSADPYESNQRKILNFGHTIGHALESYYLQTATPLLHGEAIAIGMYIETQLATRYAGLADSEAEKIFQALKMIPLPTILAPKAQELIPFLLNDKKNNANTLRFSLPTTIGSCAYDIRVELTDVLSAIENYYQLV